MRGKNKLIAIIFALIALVTTSVVFAFGDKVKTIPYAKAVAIDGFSSEFQGGVIFSAERVYFAEDDVTTDGEDRDKSLSYNGYQFNSIYTNKGKEYFADYKLYRPTDDTDYSHKDVINDGDFVMVDDDARYTADVEDGGVVSIKQGIMVTLGGYYHNSVSEKIELNGENEGANLEYVSVQATLNGEIIELPSSRTYKSRYQDFTWFITPTIHSEGHYEISLSYMANGVSLRQEFDFYLLLQSLYEDNVYVNNQTYSSKPVMENAITKTNSSTSHLQYSFYSGTNLNYPTLTFDYTRYDLSYTHTSGDIQKTVNFDYDEQNSRLIISNKVYNDEEITYYPIQSFGNFGENINTIVTLMFVDNGKYDFNFDYVYKTQGERVVISKSQVSFANISLDIYGYQLKYSKAGFVSADMTYLEIYQNGTMFILVNGFTDDKLEKEDSVLGVNYKLISTSSQKTGTVLNTSKTASIVRQFEDEDIDEMLTNENISSFIDDIQYQKTDRGLWLTLNDTYYLKNDNSVQSYYYYSPNKFTTEFITARNEDNTIYVNREDFTKVTTFTAPGYYLVQVKYSYKDETNSTQYGIQYFAFQITSATPMLELYKTTAELYDEVIISGNNKNNDNFYAHEYTNQNVYATWKDTEIFESKITGKLYYSVGQYPSESDLKAVANGATSSNITKATYDKNAIIKDSGSYLLVLEVERSATKTYTYFTIDNENISGLQVYEVATNSIDNKAVYSIKRDSNLNYITLTSKGVINGNFTIDWLNKRSGAKINASYKFTPFVKTGESYSSSNTITIQNGTTTYKYILNEYGIGETSNAITIQKPKALNAALDVNNVLTDQGIYEFELIDEAGNILRYIVIIDRTETVINATYGDQKNAYASGEMVAEYVELEWGTHKAINLLNVSNGTTVDKLLKNETIDNYYSENGNNLFNITNMFKQINSNNLFVVKNDYTEIKLRPFDANLDIYYVITSTGTKQIKYPDGQTVTGWNTLANKLFDNVTNMGLKINLDEDSIRYYTFGVVDISGSNTSFQVAITPDKAQGTVYSSNQDGEEFNTNVRAHGQSTSYWGDGTLDENINISEYYKGQASNDGVFVFEWLVPSDEDNFRVTEVKYNYYQLMNQNALNEEDVNRQKYGYYPYKYISTNYILQMEDDIETVSKYTKEQRGEENVYRSNAINLGYETYYDTNGELISKKVTQTGLYIITRKIVIDSNDNNIAQSTEFSYVFFVDRNAIVGYSISNINEKIVGQFIHTSMPNSEGEIHYDNFTKQGLKNKNQTYIDNQGVQENIEYKVYLDTNKLPSKIQVPSGKYVTGDYTSIDTKSIKLTSYINLKLKLSIYFFDTYNLLSIPYSGTFIKLMDNMTTDRDGYISLAFSNIDNPGLLTEFKNARIHNEDGSLSLPGEYIFVITDTVGSQLDDNWEILDNNQFVFGIKLTNTAPSTDVYAYAEINSNRSDRIYANDEKTLYTNQEFVDFEIPVEDLNSYQAQLDIGNIEIWRSASVNGAKSLWLRLKSNTSGNGFVADINGIIKDITRVYWADKNGNIINQEDIDAKDRLAKYIIKLDTGLVVENGQIISYAEYVYTININYVLKNSGVQYYTYKDDGVTNSFYKSTYIVNIDRTPNSNNLNTLMKSQGNYFEDYQKWLANENEVEISGAINKEFAYRSNSTIGDYYGLVNDLYYKFVEMAQQNNKVVSNEAMYAMNVDSSTTFSKENLSMIYYRKLDFNSEIVANTRTGLLPICDTYFNNSTNYLTFSESLVAYTSYSLTNQSSDVIGNNIYYRVLLGYINDSNYDSAYGGYYEIIEKDLAGNYTQYVIYFAPNIAEEVTITIGGKDINDSETTSGILTFKNDKKEQKTFIGINTVESIANLVGQNATGQGYPYYANINIYNASGQNIKTIYTNSISQHTIYENGEIKKNGIENEIYEIIKEQGNYIIEYRNVFNERYSVMVNNYTSDKHQLNTITLEVKTDFMGQKYINISGVNTKIDENTYWYVTQVSISYKSYSPVVYNASIPINGKTTLTLSSGVETEIWLDGVEPDRINLTNGIQYLVTLTDVSGKSVVVPLSTSEDYYAYKLIVPQNIYQKDNVIYTSNQIQLSYNTDFYNVEVSVYLDGNILPEELIGEERDIYYQNIANGNYSLLTLKPDNIVTPADYQGSLRKFVVELRLNVEDSGAQGELSQSYEIWIDTRTTDFAIENINKVDKIDFVKSTLKNGIDENNLYQDYNIVDLRNSNFYTNLITETISISWTRLTSDYFTYNYELFEFINKDEYKDLLKGTSGNSYTIAPKENTTGKYILKVTINSKDNVWIASRVYSIYMATTITGLYEVKDSNGEVYDYASVTNLDEIKKSIGNGTEQVMANALGFRNVEEMNIIFESFGARTAIPMYIANTELTLHSNQDNGVSASVYKPTPTSYANISFYHIWRSNYRTFAVVMEVYKTSQSQDILSILSFTTKTTGEGENMLGIGTSKTIYDKDAEFYKLTFNSYNRNTGSNLLEQHNKIIIDIYYNNVFAKRIKGINSEDGLTSVVFNNSGSYKLEIMDEAGNVQYFRTATSVTNSFTVVVMKDILYTMNDEAPIQYAYYDKSVKLQINRYNETTGRNNYDINTIKVEVVLNGKKYTGYEHPSESTTYIFHDYGTYLITISAKLLGTDMIVKSQIVFTILNPNEARSALDFTSIDGYNIISVFSITKTVEKDVTEKFIDLLQDKSNTGGANVYNKLVTYERLIEAFGSSTQGKMKFRVLYEVDDDDLLPARRAEFSFTLNNETATINSSIKAGGKTTKEVTLKFNAANIYDQIGDCYLVINDEKVLKIDENSINKITEIKLKDVGQYYVQLVGDSGNISTSFNFTIKEPLNVVSIILIVVVVAIVAALIGTFIWLRTRMKVR